MASEITTARVSEGRNPVNARGRARVRIPSDIRKIPDREYNSITRTLEKRSAKAFDAPMHLERESMTNKELANFYAVANHFSTSYRISAMARENSRLWANLAIQEIVRRRR